MSMASNIRVRDLLLDMARTWTRLAIEVEQNQPTAAESAPRKHLVGHFLQFSSASRRTAGASGFLNLSQSGERPGSEFPRWRPYHSEAPRPTSFVGELGIVRGTPVLGGPEMVADDYTRSTKAMSSEALTKRVLKRVGGNSNSKASRRTAPNRIVMSESRTTAAM